MCTAARKRSVLFADSPTDVCLEDLPPLQSLFVAAFFQVVCPRCPTLAFQMAGSHAIRTFFLGGLCPTQEKT